MGLLSGVSCLPAGQTCTELACCSEARTTCNSQVASCEFNLRLPVCKLRTGKSPLVSYQPVTASENIASSVTHRVRHAGSVTNGSVTDQSVTSVQPPVMAVRVSLMVLSCHWYLHSLIDTSRVVQTLYRRGTV